MSSIVLSGDTSGQVSLTVPAIAGSNTVTIPAGTGTVAVQGVSTNIVSGTAVASTSGTSITFSSIPSWVKRITVMFYGVSTSGTSNYLIQLGSGSVTSTGYTSLGCRQGASSTVETSSTAGFLIVSANASNSMIGIMTLTLISSNIWLSSHELTTTNGGVASYNGSGAISLSGVLDRVVLTTVNGTDTFDAGSINILYE